MNINTTATLSFFLLMSAFNVQTVQCHEASFYYGKSLSQIKNSCPEFKRVLDETWWDIYFFEFCAFFDSPSCKDINRIKNNVVALHKVSQDIQQCIAQANQELVHLRREKNSGWINSNAPDALQAASLVLFLPLILLDAGSGKREIENKQEEINIMMKTRYQLQENIGDLEEIVRNYR